MTKPADLLPVLDHFLERVERLREADVDAQLAFLRAITATEVFIETDLGDALVTAFEAVGDAAQFAMATLPPIVLTEVLDPQDEPLVSAILAAMGIADWQFATLSPILRQHYLRVAEDVYERMVQSFELGFATDLPDPIARRVVAEGGRRAGLVDIEEGTRRAIFDALHQARSGGLGPIEAARLIRRYVPAGRFTRMERERPGSGVRYRADLIARTETLHAQRISVAQAGASAGFMRYLAFDNRTGFGDAACVARDGQEMTFDEMMAAIGEEHPGGTLSFSPVPGSQG